VDVTRPKISYISYLIYSRIVYFFQAVFERHSSFNSFSSDGTCKKPPTQLMKQTISSFQHPFESETAPRDFKVTAQTSANAVLHIYDSSVGYYILLVGRNYWDTGGTSLDITRNLLPL